MKDIMEAGNNWRGRFQCGRVTSPLWCLCMRARKSEQYVLPEDGLRCQPLFPGFCHSVGPSHHQRCFPEALSYSQRPVFEFVQNPVDPQAREKVRHMVCALIECDAVSAKTIFHPVALMYS